MKIRILSILVLVSLCFVCGIVSAAPFTSHYPTQDEYHVNASTNLTTNWPHYTTDPTKSVIGAYTGNSWLGGTDVVTNITFHIDLTSGYTIRRVYYENWHTNGASTDIGAQNVTMWGSNTQGSFDNISYSNDIGWTQLPLNKVSFDQHTSVNQADPKYLTVTNNVEYRYYRFKISNNYGNSGNTGIRRIELQTDDAYVPPDIVADFSANTTTPKLMNGAGVQFTDTSTNGPTGWLWEFGDGETSTSQNPAHTYTTVGLKTVNLTAYLVANATNTDTESKTNYINVTYANEYINADFTSSDTTGEPGTLITFTDTSVVVNQTNVVYNWSFGDGAYSDLKDNVNHVYTYAGVYDVNLSITNLVGSDYELKQQYIKISVDNDYLMKYPPSAVTIHVQEFFGAPIANATVNVTGITTSTGNWDWVATLLGYPLDEIPFNTAEMSERTDDGGDSVFLMISSVKYNVTVTAPGYTFPITKISPTEKSYTIVADYNGNPWFGSEGNSTIAEVNVTVQTTVLNATHGRIYVSYDDDQYTTTGGAITVSSGSLNRSVYVDSMPISSNTFANYTDVPRGNGESYTVQVSATNSLSSDPYVRTFTMAFKPSPVQIPGFTSTMHLWLALFLVMFTAAFAGATQAPQMSIVICIESWVYWAIGWLEPLTLEFATGELGVIGVLSLASVMAVLWNFREGKRKEKGS